MIYPDLKKLIGGSKTVITIIIAVVLSISCRAAGDTDSAAREKGQDSEPGAAVTITDVYNSKYGNDPARRNTAGIEDMITIKVKNLKALIRRAYCLDTSGKTIPGCRNQVIRLFIDGRRIDSLSPESGAPQIEGYDGELQFHLKRNAKNDEAWADILGSPGFSDLFYHEAIISVGLENEYPENTTVNNFKIIRIRQGWWWACLIGLVIYLAALVILSQKSNLLRDRTRDASAIGIITGKALAPYSLGRFQMAFWFSLVIAAFLFIWLITGAYDIITPSVLGLIGISAGTSLSAVVIDNSKDQDLINQTAVLMEEANQLHISIPALQALVAVQSQVAPAPATLVAQQDELNKKLARLAFIQPQIAMNIKALTPTQSRGFLLDILSDANGVSFHRLQMFVWTLVLGLIFIYSVWNRLSMPDFSSTLLALQGITAGTYLGFKIPEKQS